MSPRSSSRRWAAALGLAVVVEAVVAVVASLLIGWSFGEALQAFVVSNTLIGLSFGLCGALIAWHRPGHPVGWLYAVGGCLQALSGTAAPVVQLLSENGAPPWILRTGLTVFAWSWPWHIALVLPLSLLLLPDGRLPSPRWRPVAWLLVLSSPVFVMYMALGSFDIDGLPQTWTVLPMYDDLAGLWLAAELRGVVFLLLGVVALIVRYRRGDESLRRQLLWLIAAAALLLVVVTPWSLVGGTPIAVLFAIPLLPVAITVGVLRHQLLDIRLVVSRGLTYALLSALVLAAYAVLVVALSGVVSALVVALAALPLRARLQRAVDRLLYGERSDALRVASRVGGRLESGLTDTLDEVRQALRLPWVAVDVAGDRVAEAGVRPQAVGRLELAPGSELLVGLRPGERRLAQVDERVLALLSGPLNAAVQATRLSQALQASREHLVAAGEEERRRLRRDLHDGLGPLLTGVALSADAAANYLHSSPKEAAELLTSVRADSRSAIREVRRLVDDLRPPALDELGLVGALETRAAQTRHRSDGSALSARVEAPATLPPLPAAIEVAAYRIATEALTNTVRHSAASEVTVRLDCGDVLTLEVADDGAAAGHWTAGVGIRSMHERAAELGGHCEVGPSDHGGRVRVTLPLERP